MLHYVTYLRSYTVSISSYSSAGPCFILATHACTFYVRPSCAGMHSTAACRDLCAVQDMMSGLEIVIGEVNSVAPDGAHVCIAWNFEL